MILKSFVAGFTAYVLAVIYNLIQGSSLKFVFINGIKFLFTITLLALVFQMILFHFSSSSEADTDTDTDSEEADSANSKEKKDETEESEAANNNQIENDFTADEFNEDFSPFNPPEIEYEQQNNE